MQDPPTLEALLARLSEDGRALVRSVRSRAEAGGAREQFEPQRSDRGELRFVAFGTELGKLLLRAGQLPKVAFGSDEPLELAGLRAAAGVGDRIKAQAQALAAAQPQMDLFGKLRG
jgi:hypothetical protein